MKMPALIRYSTIAPPKLHLSISLTPALFTHNTLFARPTPEFVFVVTGTSPAKPDCLFHPFSHWLLATTKPLLMAAAAKSRMLHSTKTLKLHIPFIKRLWHNNG